MGYKEEEMKKKKPVILSIVAASFCIIIASTGLAGAETKQLKIGSIHPISGPISFLGVAFNRGYELAFCAGHLLPLWRAKSAVSIPGGGRVENGLFACQAFII